MRVSLWWHRLPVCVCLRLGRLPYRIAGGVVAGAGAAAAILGANSGPARQRRASAWDALGRALLRRGRPRWAAHCCRRATALESDNAQRWRHRASAAVRAGALAEAALCYRALVRLEPEAPRSYARLAHVYEQMGALRAAVEVCCQGLHKQPRARILHRRLAGLLLQSEAAAAVVSRLLSVPPAVAWHGDADAYLTQMLASRQDTDESPVAAVAADEVAPANRLDVG